MSKVKYKDNYDETITPFHTLDYKGYHSRFYIIGSAIDVAIFKDKKAVLDLCDSKTLEEAIRSVKYEIDEDNFEEQEPESNK
jgi:hypothetical protein